MQKKTSTDREGSAGAAIKAAALACVALGLAGALALMALVLGLGLGLVERDPLPLPWPWAVNLGWLVLFAAQHSGMARAAFKCRWTRVVSPRLERAAYVAASGLLAFGLGLTWQALPGEPLWQLPVGFIAVSVLGAIGVGVVSLTFDPLHFLGLRQAWSGAVPEDRLRVVGPYRFVRHPQMACLLVFLWGQPLMPPALLLLNAGLTLYVLVGVRLEEHDLERQFGTAYAEYRRRVPALLPWRPPVATQSARSRADC